MPFTYNLSSSDATDVLIAKVRLEIGDVIQDDGVRPNKDNFSDEEITYFLEGESNSVGRAAARACAVLAREWSRISSQSAGPMREQLSDVAKAWSERAKELERQYGMSGSSTFSVGFSRTDGFSEEANSGSEYTS